MLSNVSPSRTRGVFSAVFFAQRNLRTLDLANPLPRSTTVIPSGRVLSAVCTFSIRRMQKPRSLRAFGARSSTFLKWHGEVLSAANQRSLLIPEGFAHGFQTLTEDCELIHGQAEGGLHVNDPSLGIAWPIEIMELSERDRSHPFTSQDFEGVAL